MDITELFQVSWLKGGALGGGGKCWSVAPRLVKWLIEKESKVVWASLQEMGLHLCYQFFNRLSISQTSLLFKIIHL